MGPAPIKNVPCAKGALCYCLDEFSKGNGARSRITKLREAIAALAPSYAGLTDVFDEYLVSHVIPGRRTATKDCRELERILARCRFAQALLSGEPMARSCEGHTQTLDLSLKGEGRSRPINAWWVLELG